MFLKIPWIKQITGLKIFTFILILISAGTLPFLNLEYIRHFSTPFIHSDPNTVPQSHTALVLGAKVFGDNRVSDILYDRIITGAALYHRQKVVKILASGDHGTTVYDEVNTMKHHMLKNRIPGKDIFLDHAGFDTYDSLIRAKKIFGVTDVIIVSQRFHLPRAVFIARKIGLNAYGYPADKRDYMHMEGYKFREMLAGVKALFNVLLHSKPKFLGNKIPISGDGRMSWD